jgi:hypothetical protein
MERFGTSLLALVALAVCGNMTGCGGYSALCVDAMDCEGGNDADVDACVVTLDYYEDRSSLEGCEPEWDELYACVNEEARCRDRNFSADGYCDRENERWVDCATIGFNF